MNLPGFNGEGDLPEGVYQASLDEIITRFGCATTRRLQLGSRLAHIFALAKDTNYLERFIIFGSFITDKPEPNDIDILLIMRNDFDVCVADMRTAILFDHDHADAQLGASIFWIRPALLLEPLESFIGYWQTKRDGTRRGIVEVQI